MRLPVLNACFGFTFVLHLAGFAQSGPVQAADVSDDMAPIPAAITQIGIDRSEVPRYAKIMGIDYLQLFDDEIPKHSVTVRAFHLDKYLVTNAEFQRFADANPEWKPEGTSSTPKNENYLKHWKDVNLLTEQANHPVVNVTWYAAAAYCHWLGKRLPTEAEWEHAARGGLTALFPWGDQLPDRTRANFSGSGINTTTPVDKYPANGYGLFDMAGNVWEFLADEWGPYPSAAQENPVAGGDRFSDGQSFLGVKTRRVIRGGSFGGAPVNLWVEYRDSHPPENAREFVGFRCAK